MPTSRQHEVDDALHEPRGARCLESFGKNQPARFQLVDENLSRHPLVRRHRILDADAGQLSLQQLRNRQLAAPIGESDDDAVDAVALRRSGQVGRRAEHGIHRAWLARASVDRR